MYTLLFLILGIAIKVLDDLLDIYEISPCSPLTELLKSIVIVIPTILIFAYPNPWTAPMLFVLSIGFALLVPDEYLDQDIWASGTLLSLLLTSGSMYQSLEIQKTITPFELFSAMIFAFSVPSIGCSPDFLASLYKTLNLKLTTGDDFIRQEVGYTKLFLRLFSAAVLIWFLPKISIIKIGQTPQLEKQFTTAFTGYIYLWIGYFLTSCVNQVYMLIFSDSYSSEKEEEFLAKKERNLNKFNYFSRT